MNITYSLEATGKCPVDGAADHYQITIRAYEPIMVETIQEAVNDLLATPVTQEAFTLALASALGVQVHTHGEHKGVQISCEAI